MTALESLMHRWLESGTDAEKRHAAYRLTRPFDGPHEAPGEAPPEVPRPAPLPAPSSGLARGTSELLAAILACPDRGPVLPVSLQPSCGCAELTECHAGRGGGRPGVTLAQCLSCRASAG